MYRLLLGWLGGTERYHYSQYDTYEEAYAAIEKMVAGHHLAAGETAAIERDGVVLDTYIVQTNGTLADAALQQI